LLQREIFMKNIICSESLPLVLVIGYCDLGFICILVLVFCDLEKKWGLDMISRPHFI